MSARLPLRDPLSKGSTRRLLQEKGQFWTTSWVAEAMAAYVLDAQPDAVFDPAVGAGAFFTACRRLGYTGSFAGYENDLSVLAQAREAGLDNNDLGNVQVQDFFDADKNVYSAILSNPPYLRHHRIAPELKMRLQTHARKSFGIAIDGRAGLHVHFLLHCLERLASGGRPAFLLPADTCEGVFAGTLWTWIMRNFRLRTVVMFAPEAAPFPAVDTNAMIIALENTAPQTHFTWVRLRNADGAVLKSLLCSEVVSAQDAGACCRNLAEALETGLTRPPRDKKEGEMYLGDVARVMRGIATGANDFFFMTSHQMRAHKLDNGWFIRAVGRTRDCPGDVLEMKQLEDLDHNDRPTWLLNLPDQPVKDFPSPLRQYLSEGVAAGLPERPLIKMRKRWYRMEQRPIPPLLFAYLGRRACRFVLNRASVVPLTGFLCVYPREAIGIDTESLWQLLNDPRTLEQLAFVGKSYGSGAIKVEPRALERLLLPAAVCQAFGLNPPVRERQLALMETPAKYQSKNICRKHSRNLS